MKKYQYRTSWAGGYSFPWCSWSTRCTFHEYRKETSHRNLHLNVIQSAKQASRIITMVLSPTHIARFIHNKIGWAPMTASFPVHRGCCKTCADWSSPLIILRTNHEKQNKNIRSTSLKKINKFMFNLKNPHKFKYSNNTFLYTKMKQTQC